MVLIFYQGDYIFVYCVDVIFFFFYIGMFYVMSYDLCFFDIMWEKGCILEDGVDWGYYLFFEYDFFIVCVQVECNDWSYIVKGVDVDVEVLFQQICLVRLE